jgi:glucose/arabinose dehydrogenase
MRARMLRKLSKLARTAQPGCARTKAATTAERPPNATRRRDGGTVPGPRRRAQREHLSRHAAASARVADRPRRRVRISLLASAAALAAVSVGPTAASAATYPPGFSEQTVFTGLSNPTAVRFASDGRVFVAEKNGRIKVFDSLTDTTPTVFADLNVNVYNFWDRGLLGLALAPNFPADPYVYVLYTYDHELGSAAPAPRWGTPGILSDPCPTPPGPTDDGCMVSGRLSRFRRPAT